MNDGLSMSPKQYLKFVKMSDKKRLLVEGRTDKKVFEILLDALFKQEPQGSPEKMYMSILLKNSYETILKWVLVSESESNTSVQKR